MHRCHAGLSFASTLCELKQSRSQVRQFSRQKVAVVNVNKIAQDSPCARVYRQRRYSRVVDSGVYVTDAAFGLRHI